MRFGLSQRLWMGAMGAVLWLGACATKPVPAPVVNITIADLRRQAHSEALRRSELSWAQGEPSESLMWLRAARTVSDRPGLDDTRIVALRARLDQRVEEAISKARAFESRGSLSEAVKAYQEALEVNPDSDVSREALRRLDRVVKLKAIAHGGGGGPPPRQ